MMRELRPSEPGAPVVPSGELTRGLGTIPDIPCEHTRRILLWSITVAKESGDMSFTAMGDRTGYIAFGACTLRQTDDSH